MADRADAVRNRSALVEAAAAVFVEQGVQAPVREIAARAGVGMGTIYRHFPNRADLVVAVFEHQVDACADAVGPLLAAGPTPLAALHAWIELFSDFLVTKHGLAEMLSDDEGFAPLHAVFVERLVPACATLIGEASAAGELRSDISAMELMRAVSSLCTGADSERRPYDPRRMVRALIDGLAA